MRRLLFIILFGKEGEAMMAMLWAQQIMPPKKMRTYSQVPRLLKEQVAEILRNSGYEDLIIEE